tara:strand:- start:617 stop:763 length:147 start_codon:yes stop_codon:yes gene_type:complete
MNKNQAIVVPNIVLEWKSQLSSLHYLLLNSRNQSKVISAIAVPKQSPA